MKESIWRALEGAKLLREKTALITGAAAGIGKACALLFAHQGARMALVDVQEEAVKNLCRQIQSRGAKAISIAVDLTSPGVVDQIL